jgi:Trk K+ transport system NAD-binding subunit
VISGGLGGVVARLLGVRAPERAGALLLGAEPLGLALAESLRAGGCEVTVLDANVDNCRAAEEARFAVVFGNALEERTLARARPELAALVVAATTNESVNLLFAREVVERHAVPEACIALASQRRGVPTETLERHEIRVLFDRPSDLERWNVRLRHGQAETARFRCEAPASSAGESESGSAADPYLILTVERRGRVRPMHRGLALQAGDEASVLLQTERRDEAHAALQRRGWLPIAPRG